MTASYHHAGIVLSHAPLMGADPVIDESHNRWLHIHVRPPVTGMLKVCALRSWLPLMLCTSGVSSCQCLRTSGSFSCQNNIASRRESRLAGEIGRPLYTLVQVQCRAGRRTPPRDVLPAAAGPEDEHGRQHVQQPGTAAAGRPLGAVLHRRGPLRRRPRRRRRRPGATPGPVPSPTMTPTAR